ncbi:MAG TPA: FtsX-like permease family protein, partial [Gemmatimonadaceae bacterium]|nr:FtsX-like permease family protein [Gemmatimonadaceae bacterium]
ALVGAGMFYRSYRNALAVAPGFDPHGVAMASVSVTLAGYDSARAEQFLGDVAERVGREPGVTAVSYTDFPPLGIAGDSWEDLQVEGYTPPLTGNMKIERAAIGPDYFKVMRIPLVEGREFTAADDSAHARAMIVNETFARRYLAGRPALGVRVHGWGNWFTIVGVVQDVKTHRVTDGAAPYFYVPVRQVFRHEYGYTFLARTDRDVNTVAGEIARAVHASAPTVPVYAAMSLTDYVAGPLRTQEVAAQLLEVLSGVSLLLAAIGLYGMIAYLVARRTREFAVRVALGARRADVARVVASQAGGLLAAGIVAGVAGGIALGRAMQAVLFGVGPADAPVLAAAVLGMALVAFVATAIPARRAMRVDPMEALRAE